MLPASVRSIGRCEAISPNAVMKYSDRIEITVIQINAMRFVLDLV